MEQSLQEQLSSLCSNNLYHIFEKNLTKADNDSPCADTSGYTKYDSAATYGFDPVKMTSDLYDCQARL